MTPSSPAGSPQTPDSVPDLSEVLGYFRGAALLMAGRAEGLKRLDLSADGFWTSFTAILVAAPPVALSWIEFETAEQQSGMASSAGPLTVYLAHALADVVAWVLPVVVLMLLAKPLGLRRKIVPLVVATNWGGALLAWALTPYYILIFLIGNNDASAMLGLAATIATIILTARLASTAIGRDLSIAAGVVVLMIVSTLVSYGAVMDLTGVPLL
ncbi:MULTISPECIES: hypothetical protein [unclassified Aureimonas]|uniref:hypothetical protein n=1 Tax=unclassified Aureimonas TaxID=2615206 RepID=UPI0006F5F7C1|nr:MULTISPECIES: hypothetical protein [unclassified Aureimonas]KQT53891.1 hypothetical protein ASG62_11705 [Aureimonas sp. Leaf427]KQT71667.1 hypothetical protein ASG54_19455 [Aureimonas sp. Leaf460]